MITRPSWLPLWAVRAALWLVLALAVWGGIAQYGASRYTAGRNSVTAVAPFDVTMLGVARVADSVATAKTDTLIKRITVTRWKVDTLIRDVPDSLRSLPEIEALIAATQVLTAQVDTLTHTLDVERAVSRVRASVDSAALVSSSLVIVNRDDQIVRLKKRPTWRTVVTVGALGVIAGLLR